MSSNYDIFVIRGDLSFPNGCSASLAGLQGQIAKARGSAAFGVRAMRAPSCSSAASSIGTRKGMQHQGNVR